MEGILMDADQKRAMLAAISETPSVVTAAAFPGTGTSTKIGTTIPVGKVRRVWRIIIGSVDDSEQIIEVIQGDTTDQDRTTLGFLHTTTGAGIGQYGGDPLAPLFSLSAPTAVGSSDELRLAHETSAINVVMSYYDEPW